AGPRGWNGPRQVLLGRLLGPLGLRRGRGPGRGRRRRRGLLGVLLPGQRAQRREERVVDRGLGLGAVVGLLGRLALRLGRGRLRGRGPPVHRVDRRAEQRRGGRVVLRHERPRVLGIGRDDDGLL